ncbi:PAS domain S-box protein [Adonisia turfae]|uniref:histidine kinase n=1 Tax=Adonisia turfae CCMR0081 TaxID=2292702 RepID=A0A6M0RR32_9CYAN|nr:PAS domain S-box protein [Adonisia turfae]NEZ58161.1 PAS domain S-box protein [Adonisia turfae CCMR0081]
MDKDLETYQQRMAELEAANQTLRAQLAAEHQAHQHTTQELQQVRHELQSLQTQPSAQALYWVLDNLPAAAFWKDHNSVYLGCNQQFSKAAGLASPAEIVGKTDFDLPWKREEAEWFRACDRQVMESNTPELNLIEPQRQADGNQYWLETNKIPLHDSQGVVVGILGTYMEITARIEAENQLKQLNEALEQRVDERTQELQSSEARLQKLAANLPGLIFQFRLEADGTRSFPYVSEGCRDIHELEPDDFVRCFDLVHSCDRDALEQALQVSALTLSGFHHEHRIMTPSGKLKWVQTIARPEQMADDSILWDGLIIEVSDRKRAEKEQQRLLSILEATPDIVGICDAQGNHLYLNQAGQTALEIAAEDLGQVKIQAYHPPEILEKIETEALPTAIQTGMWQGESYLRSQSGQDFPVSQVILAHRDEDGNLEFLSSVMRDISDLKQAEERIRQKEAQYRQIFETVIDGLAIVNLETGEMLEANPAYYQMHGYVDQASIPSNPGAYIHPDSQPIYQEFLTTVQAGHTFSGQTTNIHRDGSLIGLEIKGLPYNYQGQPHALCVLRDISQRVKLEAERQHQEQALRWIVEGTATQTGEAFFKTCVKHLALALNMQYALIAELIEDGDQQIGKTLAFWNGSDFGENFQYNLAGTPCYNVAHNHAICCHDHSIKEQFPEDNVLVTLNAESYVGIPVLNPGGKFLGYISVINTEPMEQDVELQVFILEIFAARVGAEMERMQFEQALLASTEQIQQQAQREQLLNQIANQIRISLNLDNILDTAVQEIQRFLEVDRCHFAWYIEANHNNDGYWHITSEVQVAGLSSFIGKHAASSFGALTDRLLQQEILQLDDISTVDDDEVKAVLTTLGNKSMLVLPVYAESGKFGVISCIHSQAVRPWQDHEVDLLKSVVAQLKIALNQADLLAQSRARAEELETILTQLQKTQSQLVQSEKMSSLGQMVAGVAHEINNPVSFIYGNLTHAKSYTQALVTLIESYQQHYPNIPPKIVNIIDEIELDFLKDDLPKLFQSMEVGTERIREIIKSLRLFSRLDEAEIKQVDLHDGIDSTLTILQTRLRAQSWRPEIQVIKEYDDLPQIECYAGQLNQVFMNLLSNAVDALEELDQTRTWQQMENEPSIIRIQTQLLGQLKHPAVAIAITDNGPGIRKNAIEHLFNPFFTTKPVGKGTGLGLSISYQIITETHGGTITYNTEPGQGTTFTITLPIRQ